MKQAPNATAATTSPLGASAADGIERGDGGQSPVPAGLNHRLTWALAAISLLLATFALAWGTRQQPHPDAWRPIGLWDVGRLEWWLHPLERNAFRRFEIRGHLHAVSALPDGSQVWAVGSKGLIVHSADGGRTWQQRHPKAPSAVDKVSGGFGLLGTAFAQSTAQQAAPNKAAPAPAKSLEGATVGEARAKGQLDAGSDRAKNAAAAAPSTQSVNAAAKKGVATPARSAAAASSPPASTASAPPQTAVARPTPIDPLSADLYAVQAIDERTVVAVGAGGTILLSNDGGSTWRAADSGVTNDLRSVSFAGDGRRGWAGGTRVVLRTDDGGASWRRERLQLEGLQLAVALSADGRTGVIATEVELLFTRDERQTWVRRRLDGIPEFYLRAGVVMARDGQRFLLAHGGGVTLGTFAANDLVVQRVVEPRRLTSVALAGSKAWAAGHGGLIVQSNDAGASWPTRSDKVDVAQQRPLAVDPGQPAAAREASSSVEPRPPNTQASLSGIAFASDGERGWAVGANGTLLATSDGGNTWHHQSSGERATWSAVALSSEDERAFLLGLDGTLSRSEDGGLTWTTVQAGIGDRLESMYASGDLQRIWAAGISGRLHHSSDGGRTWLQQPVSGRWFLLGWFLFDVSVSDDGQRAVAAAAGGPAVYLRGQGLPWEHTSDSPGINLGVRISRDGRRLWRASSFGTVHRSDDGGKTWMASESVGGEQLVRLDFSPDGRHGWAVGDNGLAAYTEDGGATWRARRPPTNAGLVDVRTDPSGQRAWAVADDGGLMNTVDGGLRWTVQKTPEGSRARTIAVAADWRRALAVGPNGDILSTDDGGASWRDRVRYERYAPPLASAAGVMALLLLAVCAAFGRLRPVKTEPRDAVNVAPELRSDQPLVRLQDDRLGHRHSVLALSDFIRNPGTEPRLTIAITAPWGMGKTSMMGMLREQLNLAGFRTAWFNAWHHQQEGRQLSALFNAISAQAVPSIFREPIAAMRVRTRLLWSRGWLYRMAWVVLIVIVLDLFMGWRASGLPMAEFAKLNFHHHWLNQPRVAVTPTSLALLNPFAASGSTRAACENPAAAARKPPPSIRPEVYCYLQSALARPWDGAEFQCADPREIGAQRCVFANTGELMDLVDRSVFGADSTRHLVYSERQAIAAAVEKLAAPTMTPTIVHFLPLLALLGVLMTKGFAVYGVELLRPVRNLLAWRHRAEQDKEPAGTIERYRTEFKLLTDALDGRLVVFIDDLDRCDAATVNSLLEITNYMIDHGRCFIVLGAAMDKVKACIEPRNDADKANRERYQTEYLRKLVHIELPVPPPSDAALEQLLSDPRTAEAAPVQRRKIDTALLFLREQLSPLLTWIESRLAIVAFALLVVLLVAVARSIVSYDTPQLIQAAPRMAAASAPAVSARVERPGDSAGMSAQQRPAATPESFAGPVGVRQAPAGWTASSWGLLAAAALLVLGLAGAVARTRPFYQRFMVLLGGAVLATDTPRFMEALRLWKPVVRLGDTTPRGIKRFTNRARLFALHERKSHAEGAIAEEHVVALTAIHHVQPEFLQRLVKEKLPEAQATVDLWVERLRRPIGMEPTDAQQQAAREQQVRCLHAHVARFGFADVQALLRFQELLERVSVR